MRYLSVCSGIEAASVAWRSLEWHPVAFAEIDPFPRAVLKQHSPDVPNWGDITRFKEWPDAAIDVLVGGTPCQSFSVAGLRKGLADPRGNLALTYLAIAGRYRPRWLVWENVPGVLSATSHIGPDPREPTMYVDATHGPADGEEIMVEDEYDADEDHAFACFLAGLSELGYGFAYGSLDAQYAGLAQRRNRVFVVGYLGDWRRAAAVLFERESLSGHPAPRREAGEGITSSPQGISGSCSSKWAKGSGGPAGDEHYNLIACDVADTLTVGANQTTGFPSGDVIAHSLRADGFDASEDGTGRGTPLIPIDLRQSSRGEKLTNNRAHGSGGAPGSGVGDDGDPAFTVSERGQAVALPIVAHCQGTNVGAGVPSLRQGDGGVTSGVPFTLAIRGRGESHDLEYRQDDVANAVLTPNGGRGGTGVGAIAFSAKDHAADAGAIAPTLRAGGHDKSHANAGVMPAVVIPLIASGVEGSNGAGIGHEGDPGMTLDRTGTQAVAFDWQNGGDARGLALKDTAQLQREQTPAVHQGMVVRRLTPRECARLQGFPDDYLDIIYRGKPATDGHKYKALGNSFAVPVIRWIGERIQLVEDVLRDMQTEVKP